jgi:hypothetical protein
VAVLPLSERVNQSSGWEAGSAHHVFMVQALCLAINTTVLVVAERAFSRWLGGREQ